MQEGEASLVLRLLRKRLGGVPLDLEQRIRGLSVNQLEDLGEALLDFGTPADLVDWLNCRANASKLHILTLFDQLMLSRRDYSDWIISRLNYIL